jgi:hypothetical protein
MRSTRLKLFVSAIIPSASYIPGFPPFRQKKGERMGHGKWFNNKRSDA